MDINLEATFTIDSSTVNLFSSREESMAMEYEVILTAISKNLNVFISNLELML